MTKQEWKLKYSAFRRIHGGLFNTSYPAEAHDPSFSLALEVVSKIADQLHWSVEHVMMNKPGIMDAPGNRVYHPIIKGVKIWQIRRNSRQ